MVGIRETNEDLDHFKRFHHEPGNHMLVSQ